ncbi:hypothetical protein L3X38_040865 [Prunus dulcis]|uniref:Uncharacterized protein n=1 Tax=Prunus dulcis TaxID=3755 RepID=A0AAD4YI32_PRUDU|nr:hypothetical protein L3X38_040865 [Prunus dulcis]
MRRARRKEFVDTEWTQIGVVTKKIRSKYLEGQNAAAIDHLDPWRRYRRDRLDLAIISRPVSAHERTGADRKKEKFDWFASILAVDCPVLDLKFGRVSASVIGRFTAAGSCGGAWVRVVQ